MRMMTFNVRIDVKSDGMNAWAYRKEAVAEVIRQGKYAIMGLQEPSVAMLEELCGLVLGYQAIGEPRDELLEMAPILYDPLQVHLLSHKTIWLSLTPNQISAFPESHFPRTATIAIFETLEKKRFCFVNTHLDYASELVQKLQMQVLIEYLNQMPAIEKLPIIILGDFNATKDQMVHQYLKHARIFRRSLHDVFDSMHVGLTYHGFGGEIIGEPIDFVYATENLMIKDQSVIFDKFFQMYPSDHYPLAFSVDFFKSVKNGD
jgi:endonuclease/exonuclease/phosphatase family metal-dependent hydrolase